MLHVAIYDPVQKWRIFELFWPKSIKSKVLVSYRPHERHVA